MKKILSLLLVIAAMLFVLSSCDSDSMDSLQGIYTPPTISSDTVVAAVNRATDANNLHHFTIRLTGGTDDIIFELLGTESSLQSATFMPSSSSELAANTFIADNSTVNGSKVTRGTILVISDDNVNYEVSGVVWTEDGAITKFDATGRLTFAD